MRMTMRKIAILIFVLCTNTIYTDQYIHVEYMEDFECMKDFCEAVGRKSAKIQACLKKHKFMELEPGSEPFNDAINELARISEHELTNNPKLKKQFLSMLWIGRIIGCLESKDYAQAMALCDTALDEDPSNALLYAAKSEIYKEWGNAEQADIYRRIAMQKGFDNF